MDSEHRMLMWVGKVKYFQMPLSGKNLERTAERKLSSCVVFPWNESFSMSRTCITLLNGILVYSEVVLFYTKAAQ